MQHDIALRSNVASFEITNFFLQIALSCHRLSCHLDTEVFFGRKILALITTPNPQPSTPSILLLLHSWGKLQAEHLSIYPFK